MCDATISNYFPLNTGAHQGCVLAPTPFNTWDHVLGRMPEKTDCEVSFGTVRITDLDFADDAVIFAETTEVLASALDLLSKKADPLGFRVSWIKTKVKAFVGILDATVESILVSGENVEVSRRLLT